MNEITARLVLYCSILLQEITLNHSNHTFKFNPKAQKLQHPNSKRQRKVMFISLWLNDRIMKSKNKKKRKEKRLRYRKSPIKTSSLIIFPSFEGHILISPPFLIRSTSQYRYFQSSVGLNVGKAGSSVVQLQKLKQSTPLSSPRV